VLYDQTIAETEIRAIAKEVDPTLRCSVTYDDRRKAMLVTLGETTATAVVEFSEQRLVSAFGLSSHPRTIDPNRRATIKSDFDLASKAAKSTLAWAKGRFGAALTRVSVAERGVAAPSAAQAEKFEAGERLVYAYVGDTCHSLWRDAAGRITVLDS
jgi:hypothetical protein